MKKIKFIISLIIILIVFLLNFNLIAAAEETTSTTTSAPVEKEFIDVSKSLGLEEGSAFGSGISVSSRGIISFLNENSELIFNRGKENQIILSEAKGVEMYNSLSEISFVDKDCKITINGNKFENIIPKSKENPSFIKLDRLNGDIGQARFTTSASGEYTINGANFISEANSLIKYNIEKDEDGQALLTLKNSKIKAITQPVFIRGENVELYKGYNLVEGDINFDGKGNTFIKRNANINNIEASVSYGNKPINVVFDKDSTSVKNSLMFTKDKLKISSGDDYSIYRLNFKEDNPYLKIEENDRVQIIPDKYSDIEIDSRKGTEFIPKISINSGSITLIEDGYVVETDKDLRYHCLWNFLREGYFEDDLKSGVVTTSPVEVQILSEEEKLIVDNFNRMALIPKNKEEGFGEFLDLEARYSTRLKYNYLNEENLETLLGTEISFKYGYSDEVSEGVKQMTLGRIRDYWETLTPQTKEATHGIIVNDEYFSIKHFSEAGAFASPYSQSMTFREDDFSIYYSVFRHESAHLRHYSVSKSGTFGYSDEKMEEYNSLKEEEKALLSIITNSAGLGVQVDSNIMNQYQSLRLKRISLEESFNAFDFENNWKTISGKYDTAANDDKYGKEFSDVDAYEPAGGYARAYGATCLEEDIATLVEAISDPYYFEFAEKVFSEDNEYRDVYKKKIDLLYEHKFISKEEYLNVIRYYK